MNKLFTKIVGAALGLTMAIGAGVAVSANNGEVVPVHAAVSTRYTLNTATTKIATNAAYNSYTDSTNGWAVTLGSMQSAGLWLGSNSSQKAKMRLDSNGAAGGSISGYAAIASAIGVQSSATYYAAIIQTANSISNVDTVNLTYTTPGGTAPSEAWILYSTNSGSSWSVFQKVTSLSASGTTFTHSNVTSARYAFVIHSTNYCQFKVPVLTFKGTDASTQTISGSTSGTAGTGVVLTTNATSSTQWTITANTCGASLSANTGTSVTVNATSAGSVTVQATCGSEWTTATHTIEFAAADAESITVTGSSSLYVGDSDITLTATPENFSPATYTWNSSNTGVATISGSGATATLHAVSKGTTVITASASGTGGTVTSNEFTVTIKRFSIALSSSEVSMKASKSTTVTVTPTDANGTVVVSAVSNDTSVATVSVSGTTITINSGSVGGVSTTITVSAKDNGGASGYHQTATQTINVSISAGYTIGSVVTSLPSTDTLVYLIGNRGGATEYFVTSGITETSTSEDNAALYLLSSSGTLRYYNEDAGTYGNYISHGSKTTVSSVSSNPTEWTIGNETNGDVTYENLILDGDRFLSDNNSNALKAYATSNLGDTNYHEIRAYLAVAATPTATLSGDSVSAFKGDSNDTSLTLTLANFTASGLTVSYMDDGEEEYAASSSIATVTCGHTTGDNTVTVAFGAIGSTTVKLTITRSNGSPFEKTFTVTVKEKPGSITINNTLEDGYLVIKNGTTAQEGYTELDVTAKQAAPDQSSDYTGLLKYTVTTGGDYVGVSATGRVYGKATGTGTVRVYANDLTTVESFINVKVMDDYRNGVSSVTFNANLTADAGDSLDISEVFATRVATTRFGSTDTIADAELKFSYAPNDYENAVGAAEFFYACEETTEEGETEVQTVYVYCTLDESWSSSFSISVTQTSIDLTGLSINGVIGNEMNLLRNTTHQISLTFTPSNASDKSVTYSIDDELSDEGHSVTVSNTGLISAGTAVGKSAMVVVTSNFDSSISDYVVVTVTRETMTLTADMPASYVKVTSTADLTSGKYLIVSEASNVVMTEAVNSTANKTTYENIDSSLDSYCFTYNASTGSLKGPNGSYIGKTASGNGMDVGSTEYTHTITFDNGNAVITASGGSILRYNTSWGGFRYYGSGQQAVQLYKQSGGETEVTVTDALFAVVDAAMSLKDGSSSLYDLGLCNASGTSFNVSAWTTLGSRFTASIISDNKLAYARADENGNEIEQFLAVYDYVIGKKENGYTAYSSANDFLGRVASGKISASALVNPLVNIIGENTNTVAIIVIISMVSVTAIGGYFFLRKRKENI